MAELARATSCRIERRALLAGALCVAAGPPAHALAAASRVPVPPSGRLDFRIMRQGSKIGEHHSVFEVKDELVTIRAEAELVVHLMGIPVFRYSHHAVERWMGGTFMALETKTNDDGHHFWLRVEREPAGLAVIGSAQPRYVAPAEALAMTHWNRAQLTVPKINPQKGDLLRPTVVDRGLERLSSAGGALPARHYNFSGQAMLDVWYDTDEHWAGLAFLGGDQSQITLERM